MGVKKEYDTLGSLRVQFGGPVISITFFDIAEQYNDHGLLTFRAIVPEDVTRGGHTALRGQPRYHL